MPERTRLARVAAHPVVTALVVAAALHLLWWWLLANSGGDIAAQDAWAEFARTHPGSAYNLAWYGGMHPVSYSILSPYVMALLGVRTTMIVVGTVSSGLLALVLVRSNALRRPVWPALYGAVALTGNAVSGRVTFGLGTMFALAAIAVLLPAPAATPAAAQPTPLRRPHAVALGALAALATASSALAGLFLGIVAAALWLQGRRRRAYVLGLPPVAVVAFSAWAFPFSGEQPMPAGSIILPFLAGVLGFALVPATWRTVRVTSAVYAVAVVLVWLVPSPIGSNVTRLGLLFGGVLMVALTTSVEPLRRPRLRWVAMVPATTTLAVAIVASSVWQVATAGRDAVNTRPTQAWTSDVQPLLDQLDERDANLGRTEVVPSRSHREAAALAPYVNLARGWNRQADAERNALFYTEGALTAATYRDWLDRWAVHYVVLPEGEPDVAAQVEAALVEGGLRYLRPVWSDASWRLYEVKRPAPLADAPAVVVRFDEAGVVLMLPAAATVVVRIPASPWLSLVDAAGTALQPTPSAGPDSEDAYLDGCLGVTVPDEPDPADPDAPQPEVWTVLHAPRAGVYRIAAPYKLPPGTACPEETETSARTPGDA
ncbi:MAG: MFS transporter [Nocardioides sp.]